ncbi:hypothetical protein L6164_036825 [Bauhinia variegata]|uniref:Uncharacterized protein n=1 Tax=Bauhinia variegata TaxID=167791 RepID=A0ACB9KIE1_BAUVA|nr:hypothetical protein L6164_036825 [Bauhinia variegata]
MAAANSSGSGHSGSAQGSSPSFVPVQQHKQVTQSTEGKENISFASLSLAEHTHAGIVLSCNASIIPLNSTWILDSGATNHITCQFDAFTTYMPVSNWFVSLPNGTNVQVTHIGTVALSSTLVLQHVLFVPSFSFNLISVSKLDKDSQCAFVVQTGFCYIKEPHGWKTIGLAREFEGLYHLVAPVMKNRGTSTNVNTAAVNNSKATNKFDLWHFRFGHASFDRIKPLFANIDGVSCNAQIPCDVCHFAKQKRLPFPSVYLGLYDEKQRRNKEFNSEFPSIGDDTTWG